jgi:hypothetical protein
VLTKVLAALTIVTCMGIAAAAWCGGHCPFCSTTDRTPTDTQLHPTSTEQSPNRSQDDLPCCGDHPYHVSPN